MKVLGPCRQHSHTPTAFLPHEPSQCTRSGTHCDDVSVCHSHLLNSTVSEFECGLYTDRFLKQRWRAAKVARAKGGAWQRWRLVADSQRCSAPQIDRACAPALISRALAPPSLSLSRIALWRTRRPVRCAPFSISCLIQTPALSPARLCLQRAQPLISRRKPVYL